MLDDLASTIPEPWNAAGPDDCHYCYKPFEPYDDRVAFGRGDAHPACSDDWYRREGLDPATGLPMLHWLPDDGEWFACDLCNQPVRIGSLLSDDRQSHRICRDLWNLRWTYHVELPSYEDAFKPFSTAPADCWCCPGDHEGDGPRASFKEQTLIR